MLDFKKLVGFLEVGGKEVLKQVQEEQSETEFEGKKETTLHSPSGDRQKRKKRHL